jgi:hypothetical protein
MERFWHQIKLAAEATTPEEVDFHLTKAQEIAHEKRDSLTEGEWEEAGDAYAQTGLMFGPKKYSAWYL